MDRTKLFGLLHNPDGTPVQRQVRILKVGIGVPKGPDVHVWIDARGKWILEIGRMVNRKREAEKQEFATRAEAQKAYREIRRSAEVRGYPTKIPYFTFLRMGISGDYEHDFEAIEQHGPVPNEIQIVFLSDAPLAHAYQWYTETRLCCEGDGMAARRRLDLAETDAEKRLAAEALRRGEKWFMLPGTCFVGGCPFAKSTIEGDKERPPRCKPHGRLYFQLLNSPRFGGTASFDTTGYRSISQLHSCIQEIKTVTGRGDAERGYIAGIPMTLVLRPYKAMHNGRTSVQYGVSLEYRAESAVALAQRLIAQGKEFRQALDVEVVEEVPEDHRLAAPASDDDPDADAPAMASEFYPEEEEPEEQEDGGTGIQMPRRKSETTK